MTEGNKIFVAIVVMIVLWWFLHEPGYSEGEMEIMQEIYDETGRVVPPPSRYKPK